MKSEAVTTVQISIDGQRWRVVSAYGGLVRRTRYVRPNGLSHAARRLAQDVAMAFGREFRGPSVWL